MSWARITNDARKDLKQIRSWIARDSKENADRFIHRIRAAIDGLKLLPESGSLLPEFEELGLREIFVGDYRFVYRLTGRNALVMLVQHGTKPLPDSLGRS